MIFYNQKNMNCIGALVFFVIFNYILFDDLALKTKKKTLQLNMAEIALESPSWLFFLAFLRLINNLKLQGRSIFKVKRLLHEVFVPKFVQFCIFLSY